MLNLKKTAVAVALGLGSSAVLAGTMGPVCSAVNVTVPCERTGWDVGIYALYLQPSYSDNVAYVGTTTPTTTSERFIEHDAEWGWGFKLEGSYHFGTGTDLNLNWYHLDDNGDSRTYGGTFAFFTPIVDLTTETFEIIPKWDAVNLEFGQHVDFGEFKNIRFHGGAQYARIETARAAYASTPGTALYVSAASTSKYNGFGPRIGADMSYDLGNGFAIYGNGATAILAGTSKVNGTFASNPATAGVAGSHSASRTAIVPELEAKLGLKYTYAMAQGDLTLDAGYLWQNYFHAQQVVRLFAIDPADSDFGVQGPYIGLKWMGSVA